MWWVTLLTGGRTWMTVTDPLNDLLDTSSPRVSSPSSAIDHEMKVLALRTAHTARPASRRRRTGRRISLGLAGAVLALTGGAAAAAAAGLQGPWSWWVNDPDLTTTITTADHYSCEVRWNVHEAGGSNGDTGLLTRKSATTTAAEDYLAHLDPATVDTTIARQERQDMLALSGHGAAPEWDIASGALADAVSTAVMEHLDLQPTAVPISVTSEIQCTPDPQ